MDLLPVILCGGAGERLTPLSTPEQPKQFLPMHDKETLFSLTCARAQRICAQKPIQIVTTAALEPLAAMQAPPQARFLIEPMRRNTAAAVALAARSARPDDILWIMPCDHLIDDEDALAHALLQAQSGAARGRIALLGIKPTCAHTGYGYISCRPGKEEGAVDEFTEKPTPARARAYLQSGDYWWNSGMVIARADLLLQEFAAHAPAYINGTPYAALPARSFDTVILEKTARALLIPADMGWVDVGGHDRAALFQKSG